MKMTVHTNSLMILYDWNLQVWIFLRLWYLQMRLYTLTWIWFLLWGSSMICNLQMRVCNYDIYEFDDTHWHDYEFIYNDECSYILTWLMNCYYNYGCAIHTIMIMKFCMRMIVHYNGFGVHRHTQIQ